MLGPVRWLAISLCVSIVLTVIVNAVLWAFPDIGRWIARRIEDSWQRHAADAQADDGRVRVIVPWKAMIIASVVLTVALNIALRVG